MTHRPGIEVARKLRQQDVPAEGKLWAALRGRAMGGFKFRRQYPVAGFVADFACAECSLIVEIDGESHLARSDEDKARTEKIEAAGWKVLRFWNTEVYEHFDAVKEAIYRECELRSTK